MILVLRQGLSITPADHLMDLNDDPGSPTKNHTAIMMKDYQC